MTQFGGFDPAFHADPYPLYAQLRAHAPILWMEDLGAWLVTRYEDIARCIKDPATFSHDSFYDEPVCRHDASDPRQAYVIDSFSHMMMYRDGDEHTRMRRQSNRTFTLPEVRARRPRIEQICRTLLQRCRQQGTFDYAQQFAILMPSMVIADYLGIPAEDRDEIRELADKFSVVFEPGLADDDRHQMLINTVPMVTYLDELIAARRAKPAADFVSHLVGIAEADGAMTTDELRGNLMHLLVAGNETTTNLLEHLIGQLSRSPKMRSEISGHPDRINDYLEETLRYEAPIQVIARKTTTDVTVAGQPIPEGALVGLVVGSANRDEYKFPDPDRFDPARSGKAHLSFALGPHFCLGAPLARLEGTIALELLTSEFNDLIVDDGVEPVWKPDLLLRGYSHLQVRAA